jgi:vitamin B12 transporter
LILNVHHKLFAGIKNDLRIRYIDRVGQAPYWLVDDRIYYQKDQFQIFVEATNLLNTSYTEVMTPMPGRWFRAGLQLNLEF